MWHAPTARSARRIIIAVQRPGAQIAEVEQCRVIKVHIDVPAKPCAARGMNRRDQAQRHIGSGHEIDDGQTHARRRRVRFARHVEIVSLGLREKIIARPIAPLALAAIGRAMGADDGRIGGLQLVIRQTKTLGYIAAQREPAA